MVFDALFPDRCRGCRRGRVALCERCLGRHPPPWAVDGFVGHSAAQYTGRVRAVILEAKYRGRYRALDAFVPRIVRLVRELDPADVVVAPPAAPEHLNRRGLDPGAYLAARVAGALRLPFVTALARAGVAQTGRRRAARLLGPTVVARRRVDGRVLLIDDVVTTGGTLRAAAHALRVVGATSVVAATAARVPDSIASQHLTGPTSLVSGNSSSRSRNRREHEQPPCEGPP